MNQVMYYVPLKTTGAAYLWWLFLGGFGAHKFYLGRPGMGILYLCTFGVLWLGLIWDLFTLPGQVRRANDLLMSGSAGEKSRSVFGSIEHSDSPPGNFARADELIASYKAKQEAPAHNPAAPAAQDFGRRRLG
jgi:TM2 domain-containing membrane protein YozV